MPAKTIDGSSVLVVSMNSGRKTITFGNSSLTQVIYIDNTDPTGLTILNAGYALSPGEKMTQMLAFDGEDMQQPWSAIASAAGGVLYYKETFLRAGDSAKLGGV